MGREGSMMNRLVPNSKWQICRQKPGRTGGPSPSLQMDRDSQSFSGGKKKAPNRKYRAVELISGSWAHLFFWIMRLQQWEPPVYVEYYQHWANRAQCQKWMWLPMTLIQIGTALSLLAMKAFIHSLVFGSLISSLGYNQISPLMQGCIDPKLGQKAPKEQTDCMNRCRTLFFNLSKILEGTLAVFQSHKQRPKHL